CAARQATIRIPIPPIPWLPVGRVNGRSVVGRRALSTPAVGGQPPGDLRTRKGIPVDRGRPCGRATLGRTGQRRAHAARTGRAGRTPARCERVSSRRWAARKAPDLGGI